MNSRTNIDKDDLIKKEINRLKRLYKDLDDKKKKTLEGLIEECAYMRVSLKELRGFVDELGYVDLMEQGSYSIIRESPYYKAYISMLQRYTTATEKLMMLLPKETVITESDDGFNDFVSERSD